MRCVYDGATFGSGSCLTPVRSECQSPVFLALKKTPLDIENIICGQFNRATKGKTQYVFHNPL